MDFFATAAKGTEGALRDELRELRVPGVRADRGGVHFAGDWSHAFRAALDSRIALRILHPLGEFDAPDGDALYEGVRAIEWAPFLTPRQTLAVRATVRDSGLTHSGFVALRTKDAIVDRIRDRVGSRPSVNVDDPDVGIFVHLAKDRAKVYVDVSGESLHKRGWRSLHNSAPLKETLAAAILRLSGWDRRSPLRDPMCGSGTIAIEAALWARGIPPGLTRPLGIERWALFDGALGARLRDVREQLRAAIRPDGPDILASDIDAEAVRIAEENARQAGVKIAVARRPIAALEPTNPPGAIVVNPPYGERLAGGAALYREMGAVFERMKGHRVAVLAGSREVEPAIRRKPEKWLILFNGPIECRLLVYRY